MMLIRSLFHFWLAYLQIAHAFSMNSRSTPPSSPEPPSSLSQPSEQQPVGNVLILDHLNINHEKGRHDWLKAFYFDFLNCVVDPRKQDNLQAGKKTLWANIGAQQFHLPEGQPQAQVLDGIVTLAYPDLDKLQARQSDIEKKLQGSQFSLIAWDHNGENSLLVTDPWGNEFQILKGGESTRDVRGRQQGESSEGYGMQDLKLYTSPDANLAGIARFYEQILGAPVLVSSKDCVVISVGPQQTLSFTPHPEGKTVKHEDMIDEGVASPDGYPFYLSNYGPHVSMYVADLTNTYRRADERNLVYVNPRFKRRAYSLDQALEDCMFRCLDIVDPDNEAAGVILRLEHEIRSVVKRDGSKYKSCPFDDIPQECH